MFIRYLDRYLVKFGKLQLKLNIQRSQTSKFTVDLVRRVSKTNVDL